MNPDLDDFTPPSEQPPVTPDEVRATTQRVVALLEGAAAWYSLLGHPTPLFGPDSGLERIVGHAEAMGFYAERDAATAEVDSLLEVLDSIEARGDRPDPPERADARDRLLELADKYAGDERTYYADLRQRIVDAGLPG